MGSKIIGFEVNENEDQTSQRRLRSFLVPEKEDIWVIVVYGILSGILALVVPIAVQTLVNTIGFGSMLQPILILTFLVLVILGLSALMRVLQVYLMEVIQQRLFVRTALSLSEEIPKIKISAFEVSHGPELVNRFFDVLTVQKSTALIVIDGLSILLQTTVGMVLLAFYHPFLFAFDLLLILIIFAVIFVLGKGAIKTSILESKKKYHVAGWLEELARIPILFKKPNSQDFVLSQSDALTVDYLQMRRSHFKIFFRQVIGALSLQVLASSLLLGLGGWLVVRRQLTLGQLVAAELVVTTVVTGVGKFGKYLESYYDLVAAADKLGYLLELPKEDRHETLALAPHSFGDPAVSLSVNQIEYSYNNKPCLSGLDLKLKAGEKMIIFGKSGSGKSTLCDLLYQLEAPTQGLIELGGISSKDMTLQDYRSHLSFLRGIELFGGSLLDNLRIHRQDLSSEEIYRVLRKLEILEKIESLPEGLETVLSASGAPLSSSVAKLVTLTRAILSEPKFMILDGFLDDLNEETRKKVIHFLFTEFPGTVLLTTGIFGVAELRPKYWVLERGQLRPQSGER